MQASPETALPPQSDITKYKANYDSLLNGYLQLCDTHREFLDKSLDDSVDENIPQITDLLDHYAVRVARKKDTYEKIGTLEGMCEGSNVFMAKRWKRKCRFILELIIDIYKSYESHYKTLIESGNNDESSEVDNDELRYNLNTIVNTIEPIENSNYDKWDIFISVSYPFLKQIISNCNDYKAELLQRNFVKNRLFYVVKKAKDQRAKLKSYVSRLREEIRLVEKQLKETKQSSKNSDNTISTDSDDNTYNIIDKNKEYYENRIYELEKIIKEEEKQRKKLHNQFQELVGNTRVYCRIKPSKNADSANFLKLLNDDKIIIPTQLKTIKNSQCFIYDRVFNVDSSQDDIYSTIDSLITSGIDGYNVCVLAYGQSGSGKTYTLFGNEENNGIFNLSVKELFQKSEPNNNWNYKFSMGILEIYQEDVYDLLVKPSMPSVSYSNRIYNGKISKKDNNIQFQGFTESIFNDENEANELLKSAISNRTIGTKLYHMTKGRSHLLVFIKIKGFNKTQGLKTCALLTLCDLAASDFVAKSTNTDDNTSGNKSLNILGKSFGSLRNNSKSSYKDCKLNHFLKSCFNNESKCVFFINIKSNEKYIYETIHTLTFGQLISQEKL